MEKEIKTEKLSLITAACISAGLILYFIIMNFFGLAEILTLRVFNFFILAGGIVWVINKVKNLNGGYIGYLQGIGIGCMTTLFSLSIFALFIGGYLYTHPVFMQYIKDHAMMGEHLNPGMAMLGIFIEGVSSGFIFTFAAMQYYKVYEDKLNEPKKHVR